MSSWARFPDLAPAEADVQFKEAGLEMMRILVDTLVDATEDASVLGSGVNEVLQAPLAAVASVLCSRLVAPASLFPEWSPAQTVHEVSRARGCGPQRPVRAPVVRPLLLCVMCLPGCPSSARGAALCPPTPAEHAYPVSRCGCPRAP